MWFFEFVFLKGYYGTMKRNDVRKICREIVAGYQRLGSAYETDIDEYARLNGMYVSLYNGSGTLLFTYPNYSGSGVKQNLLTESQRKELLSRLKGDEDNEVCEIAANAENEEDTFVTYGAVFDFDGAEYMLYAQASLGSINATTVILASQLLLTTIIALALAFVLSAFLSRQLSKPIVLMSQSAQHLASGDYTVRFEGSGYTELDELSDTLNFATEEMQRVETLRQDLLANISHDLKTPLTIIKSYAELIVRLVLQSERHFEGVQIFGIEDCRQSGAVDRPFGRHRILTHVAGIGHLLCQYNNFQLFFHSRYLWLIAILRWFRRGRGRRR